mgnify:FL=1|jgi:hypothetical protein|nr:hypothetical protein [uncultured Alistipes sp.]
METIYVIIGVLVLLNIGVIALYLHVGKRLPPDEREDDRRYYDENGNHVYYDRKLIARLKKEQEQHNH